MKQPPYHIKPTTTTHFSSKFTPKFIIKFDPVLPSKPRTLTFKPFSFHSLNSSSSPSETLISILRIVPDWADRMKERGMQKNRTLYNHEKWIEHRSSLSHLRHVLSSLTSRVILSLVLPVIAFTTVAALIASYNSTVLTHWLPEFFPMLRASALPYQLTAPALGLLLVFRTEASYARFMEGKKDWTKVISGTHDFARQVMAVAECPGDLHIEKALLQYIMAFPMALKVRMILKFFHFHLKAKTKQRTTCKVSFKLCRISCRLILGSATHQLKQFQCRVMY